MLSEETFVPPAMVHDLESPNIFDWVVLVMPMSVWLCLAEDYLAVREQVDLADPLGP